jgi:hypothetical protein
MPHIPLTMTLVSGNFKSVKRGKFDDYSIRKYQSNVVADDFKFGTDKNVVVALEQDVFMVNKKHLQKVRISSLFRDFPLTLDL